MKLALQDVSKVATCHTVFQGGLLHGMSSINPTADPSVDTSKASRRAIEAIGFAAGT